MNTTEGKGGRGIGEGVPKFPRHCARCLGMVGRNQPEICKALLVSKCAAKRVLRSIERPIRIHSASRCCRCLRSIGFGYKSVSKLLNVPLTTVKRMADGMPEPEVKRMKMKLWAVPKTRRLHEFAANESWVGEWKGVRRWDECQHWAKLYWGRVISNRRSTTKYRSLTQSERRDRNRSLGAVKTLSGSRKRYIAKRKKDDPAFKLRITLSTRLHQLIKRSRSRSDESFMTFLGCSMEHLTRHLESNFKRGMRWDNHGSRWHIDHIIPCAAFDHSNPAEVERCWNWQNLRPEWAAANQRKSATITEPQQHLVLVMPTKAPTPHPKEFL